MYSCCITIINNIIVIHVHNIIMSTHSNSQTSDTYCQSVISLTCTGETVYCMIYTSNHTDLEGMTMQYVPVLHSAVSKLIILATEWKPCYDVCKLNSQRYMVYRAHYLCQFTFARKLYLFRNQMCV